MSHVPLWLGDLFAWCLNRPLPTAEREAEMLPLVAQTFSAVECLHTSLVVR